MRQPPSPTRTPARLKAAVPSRLSPRNLVPRSLGGRLAVTYAAVVALVMGVAGLALAATAEGVLRDRLADELARDARLAGALAGPQLAAGSEDAAFASARRLADAVGASVAVSVPGGRTVAADVGGVPALDGPALQADIVAAAPSGLRRLERPLEGGDRALYVAVALDDPAGAAAAAGRSLAPVEALGDRLRRTALAVTALSSLLVGLLGVGVATRITGPLRALRRQATLVARGDLDASVPPVDVRELGEVARAFNLMTRRVRASLVEQQRAQGRLEATLANLGDGVVIADPRGTVVRANAAAERMLGATEAGAGQPFVALARDHELDLLLRRAMASEDGAVQRTTVEHGRSRLVLDATAQRLETSGETLGLVVMRDVTELRRLEGMRREFVASVSHELRTPLASIRAVVETLEAGAIDDRPAAMDFLSRIVAEIDRLAMLVDELLDLARLESGRPALRRERLATDDLVRNGVERLRPQIDRAGLVLEFDLPPGLPAVVADRARVEQVLLNLVHNAIKFTPAGGAIRVSARGRGGMVEIAVVDNGSGIGPEELPRVFERFYKADKSRRSEGTGLGLAIAKHIVQAHGGQILAESVVGQGSTFRFTLPAA